MTTASTANADPSVHKVFVCKYVGTPGDDERLQEANNPISVDTNALEGKGFKGTFPFWFEDAQGRSVAYAWDEEQGDGQRNEPSLSDCPRVTDDEDETEVVATITYREATCADKTVGWSGRATVDGEEADDDLVTFAVTGGSAEPGQSVQITATIHDDDYEFDNEDSEEVFSHTFAAVPTNCEQSPTSVTAGASFTDPTCAAPGVAWAATVNGQPDGASDHVSFAVQGTPAAGQAVTVVATAEAGYVISGASSFPHTFGAVPTDCAVAPPGEVAGTESVAPKPSKKPAVKPNKTSKPQVLGTEAAVPTAVDAGLGSLPAAAPAPGSLLGQLLAGAGVALMLAAGWLMTAGRRKVGAREA